MAILTFKLVAVWPDSKDATVSKGHKYFKPIDDLVGYEVNHASFPNVYKTGYTSFEPSGRFVQQWELLLAGAFDEMIVRRNQLSTLAQRMRDDGAEVQDTFLVTEGGAR